MTLIDRARHLLTCDELRGRVPDEVTAFLREVVALEPVAYTHKDSFDVGPEDWDLWCARSAEYPISLYTLETNHDPG